ncbi:MAG: hypothetical protein HY842_13380 [Bacteroidetes bacterium]|nr:hypothetical protein [Bacteroidota bacterium]
MTAQLHLYFDNVDDLHRVIQLLKDCGLGRLTFKPKVNQKKKPNDRHRVWEGIGSVNLGGKLDHVNIRDLANED